MGPRKAFLLAVLGFGLIALAIWWAIFSDDASSYASPDCRAHIETARDTIVKGCLDWGEASATLFAVCAYMAILLGLPAMAFVVIRSLRDIG